jgi:hypothetical protein
LKDVNYDIDELMILRATQVGVVVDLASLGFRIESLGFSGADRTSLIYFMIEFLLLVMLFVLRSRWHALRLASILGIISVTGIEFFWALNYLVFEFFETLPAFSLFLLLIFLRLLALLKFGYNSMKRMKIAD